MFVIWGLPYGLGTFYDFLQGQEFLPIEYPTLGSLIPNWLPPVWLVIGVITIIIVTFEGAYRLIQQATLRDNWIDACKNRSGGRFPPIPEFLSEVVVDYFPGMSVSKDIQLLTPSVQFWARLLPSQRDQLLELVKWLGQDPRDYEEKIRRGAPPGGRPRIRFF